MFKNEMQKIADASEKKIEYMKKSPLGYIILSALAGIYLGFGITLFGKRFPLPQSSCKISFLSSIQPLLEVSRERRVPHQQGQE